jgi:hypothetical protein
VRHRLATVGAVALVVTALSSCGDSGSSTLSLPDSKTQEAYESCEGENETDAVRLGDGGQTVLIDGAGDDDITMVACILLELDASEGLVSNIDSTNSLMGRQEQSENGLIYRWSYHPDSGMDMTITED